MSFFVNAIGANQPKTHSVVIAGLGLAALLVVLVVGQLFTFENFADVLKSYGFFTNEAATPIIAALIVTLEVAALPFLLRMRLSPLARIVSMVAGWLVLVFWLGMSVWLNVSHSLSPNAGILGDTVHVPIGWWMVTFFVALGVLDICVSYGMWPLYVLRKAHAKADTTK